LSIRTHKGRLTHLFYPSCFPKIDSGVRADTPTAKNQRLYRRAKPNTERAQIAFILVSNLAVNSKQSTAIYVSAPWAEAACRNYDRQTTRHASDPPYNEDTGFTPRQFAKLFRNKDTIKITNENAS
tara:strand:+ start:951 stop:1328 length:378 start_codon:yes stop_codon:yes gene_type:complete